MKHEPPNVTPNLTQISKPANLTLMADDGPDPKSSSSSSSSMTTAAPRPTIALPPRSTFESLFRGADVSPGPLTLVSSFFVDDPDGDCRSFSQLLAGAMASPAVMEEVKEEERPMRMAPPQSPSPFFMVPAGLSPGGLLESPAMFSNNLGPFGMSHQQVLAQVTAQAAQSHAHMHIQPEFPSSHTSKTASLSQPVGSAPINMASFQQMQPPTSTANNSFFGPENVANFDQRSQPPSVIVDKPVDDGYNWRKYGQKQVKGSEYPRSYYKCTHSNCPVRKKVERSREGQVTEIIYKGQHNHQKPQSNKRGKDSGSMMTNGSNELSGNVDYAANSETISQGVSFRREIGSGQGTSEQLSGSSDGEEVGDAEIGTTDLEDTGPDPKRRIVEVKAAESTSSRTVTEPKIIVQTTSEVDLLDDGYRWRKYGQKVVKGNPHPRSYYKCTFAGCNVRKHVERASTDPKAVITTYEGKHNHDVPAARNSSHNTAAANSRVHIPIPHNQALFKRQDYGNNVDRPIAVRQLKDEHEMP